MKNLILLFSLSLFFVNNKNIHAQANTKGDLVQFSEQISDAISLYKYGKTYAESMQSTPSLPSKPRSPNSLIGDQCKIITQTYLLADTGNVVTGFMLSDEQLKGVRYHEVETITIIVSGMTSSQTIKFKFKSPLQWK